MSTVSDEIFYLIQDTEVRIRGRFLRFSAKVEGLMVKCIVYLNETKTKSLGREDKINLKGFMFAQKQKKLKDLLAELYPDLMQSYSELFGHIDEFREMRNKMAHCYFTWEENDLTSVTIWDLDETGGQQRVEPTKYTVQQISNSLQQSIKEITDDFNTLAEEIIRRVKPVIPHMFDD